MNLALTSIPSWLWDSPHPLVGLMPEWRALWDCYRCVRTRCDLILTDPDGADRMRRAGWTQARGVELGGPFDEAGELTPAESPREVDLLVLCDGHPGLDRDLLALLDEIESLAAWRTFALRATSGGAHRALPPRRRSLQQRGNHSGRDAARRPGCVTWRLP